MPLLERVDHRVGRQPKGRWRTVTVRGGEKGPLRLRVLLATVRVKDEDGRVGARERLAVSRGLADKPQAWYTLSNDKEAARTALARVHGSRHRTEELLGQGKQEVGLSHYEVRGWTGRQHHRTLSLLALWFVQVERLRPGKKRRRRRRRKCGRSSRSCCGRQRPVRNKL